MLYEDVTEIFEAHISPVVTNKYGMSGYKMQVLDSHEGGRNVIYLCEKKDALPYVLRVSYQNDRSREDYLAELEFVRYLYENGASVSNVISSTDGKLMEEVVYENQTITISLFEKAKGMQLAENNYRYIDGAPLSDYFFECGKVLGKIHDLSKKYEPVHRRIQFSDKYNRTYIEALLPEKLSPVKERIYQILDSLEEIEKTKENYGMVHFDYSDGNYHIDYETGRITVYDFDNSCFAWYMYDLAELWIHGSGWIMFEADENKRKKFMEDYFAEILRGYRFETFLSDEMVEKLPLFVKANRIENLVDAFEVEKSTGENYLDEEDLEEICQEILQDND